MPGRYTSRVINNPEDTACMQSYLQKNPKRFFSFPSEWQAWFMSHPEMLVSEEKSLSVEVLRTLLFAKIMTLLEEEKGSLEEGASPFVALLLLSGLSNDEIITQIKSLIPKKSS